MIIDLTHPPAHRALALAIGVSFVACAGGNDCSSTDPVCDVAAVRVEPDVALLTALDDTVRFRVAFLDAAGEALPDPGAAIAWGTSDGSVATVSGLALARATGNGTATITATVSGVAELANATLTVAQIGTQLAVRSEPGNVVAGRTFGTPPSVEVRDANGFLVDTATTTITAALGAGSGTLAGTLSVEAVDGVATFADLRIVGAGGHTVSFTGPGLTSATSSPFIVDTPVPSAATSLLTLSRDTIASGAQATVHLQVRDDTDTPVAVGGSSIAFHAAGGTSTVTVSATVDSGNGAYVANLAGVAAGSATTLFATVEGDTTPPGPGLTVIPGAPDPGQSTLTLGADTVASGSTTAVGLLARDAAGNALTAGGHAVTFHAAGGTSTVSVSATADSGNGVYGATLTGAVAGSATTLFATVAGDTTPGGPTLVVIPGPPHPATSTLTAGADTIALGDTTTVALVTRDAAGNQLAAGGHAAVFSLGSGTSAGTFSVITDEGDGTYTSVLTGTGRGTPSAVTATIDGAPVTSSAPTITVLENTLAAVALNDMAGLTYQGFPGGLYPGGNVPPAAHHAAGLAAAAAIQPLDSAGNPNPAGTYILLSVGMSNATEEFCSAGSVYPCSPWTFTGQALMDTTINHARLTIVNGATGGAVAQTWESPTAPNYDRVRDQDLHPFGYSEAQVQVAWVKGTNRVPTISLPDPAADAYDLERRMGNVMRALKIRYPNLRLVFLASRTYGGYATTVLNPEPYAYEGGYAMKWLIEAQVNQMAAGGTVADTLAGDLDYADGTAPWIGWGAYLWAAGVIPNPDGLNWLVTDFESTDGTHPSQSGEQKVGTALLNFFRTSPYAVGWFLK